MKKNLLIKRVIFIAITISQLLPAPLVISKAQAILCCKVNCGKHKIDKMACPLTKENQAGQNNSGQCCKKECLNYLKEEIVVNNRVSIQKPSQMHFNQILFSSISLDHQPLLFYPSINYQKYKTQNHPLFLVNSVYLI